MDTVTKITWTSPSKFNPGIVCNLRTPNLHISLYAFISLVCLLFALVTPQTSHAQLPPCDDVNELDNIRVSGGCIAKSLLDQIGPGHGDENTAYSAVYLIKRDPARSIRRGRQLFQRKFSADEGVGPRVNVLSTGDITTNRALGAGLTDSCAACHGRPRGAAGFGGDVNTRPDSRDAPHLFGLGIVEQLADEMTRSLRRQRAKALDRAVAQNRCIEKALRAKKVSFGSITACPNGDYDVSRVEGVDADLRVRPFFHQGGTASIREFIIGAFKDEMGLQAWDPVLCAVTDLVNPQAVTSPSGFEYDPAQDNFDRPPVCDASEDADGDGIVGEIDPAIVDHLEFYLLNYFKPGQYRLPQQTSNGGRSNGGGSNGGGSNGNGAGFAGNSEIPRGHVLMDQIGCTDCHKAVLEITRDRRIADVETVYDPQRGIFNNLFATVTALFTVENDRDVYPKLLPTGESFTVNNFFSDLKRHDLGPAFHEREFDGSTVTEFVTEPLWGVGSTAPYGHDGRSINLDAVIRRHGGEAASSRNTYIRIGSEAQQQILAFLETLVLFPPDDTASNLNPGDPGNAGHIQSPEVHGSINLGALFQIQEEGGE